MFHKNVVQILSALISWYSSGAQASLRLFKQ